MNLAELVQEISKENLELLKQEEIRPRDVLPVFYPNKIMTFIGVRRGGKSSIQKFLLQRLLKENKNFEDLFYINFEDDRLSRTNALEFGEAIDNYLLQNAKSETKYFFFDEIQNLENWEKLVRRLFEKKHKICLTGSSAKTLSKEIATALRGRSLSYQVFPLSFLEWLTFQGREDVHKRIQKNTYLIKDYFHLLMAFLKTGGFPEIALLPEQIHRDILKDYVDVMLFRDIIERNSFSDEKLVREIFKFSVQQAAQSFSINKLNNDLKSRGYTFSKNLTYEVIEAFQDAFAVFAVPLWTKSMRKQQVNPKKFYNIDNGIKNIYSLASQVDLGRRFENLVYLDLLRANYEIYYYLTLGSGSEVDFIAVKDSAIYAYQVSLNPKTKDEDHEKSLQREVLSELGVKVNYVAPENYIQFLKMISKNR